MPGTKITRDSPFPIFIFLKFLKSILRLLTLLLPGLPFRSTETSAKDLLFAALDTDTLGELPRGLYLNGRVAQDSSVESRDEKKGRELWEASVKFVELKDEDTGLTNWH